MIADNIIKINDKINHAALVSGRTIADIRLIAVSKRKPITAIREALALGQIDFGENYLQEAIGKIEALSGQGIFHFIGPLQSNKAKQAVQYFDYIHTIDRFKIAKFIDKHAQAMNKIQKVLIQINIGREPQKSGIHAEDCDELLTKLQDFAALDICGFMTLPPYCQDAEESRQYFSQLRELGLKFQKQGLIAKDSPLELSMGMSGDYEIAIEEGATMVRVGTAIFGLRDD